MCGAMWPHLIPIYIVVIFADTEILDNYYPLMKDWVDYITALDEKQGTHHLFDFGFHFGELAGAGWNDRAEC